MAKKKESFSAKERKELRKQNEERKQSADGRSESERNELANRRRVFAIALLCAAVLVVGIGVGIPTYMSCNYMFERNPVAVIKMDAGGKTLTMKYELFANDCKIASTNFAFLASIGWFDGAVVYDTQNDYVHFGGYRAATDGEGKAIYTHLADDESYASKQADNFSPDNIKDGDHSGMFSYLLNSDTSKLTYEDVPFALCSQTSSSAQPATEFQISGSVKNRYDRLTSTSSSTTKTLYVKPFAKPLSDDAQTMDAVEYILGLERSETAINSYFRAPVTTVTVKSVKVYNFGQEWNNVKYKYGFESYMKEELNGMSSSRREHI